MTAFFVNKDGLEKQDGYTTLTLATRLPAANSYRLTPTLLRYIDDIATDLLIDSVYPEVKVRKANSAYSPICENREDILSIIKNVVIMQNAPAAAVSQLLQIPYLKAFSDSLPSDKDREFFQKHLRKYVDIYLPVRPFEVSRTTRYSELEAAIKARKEIDISEPEAAIKARKDIERGEIIYLGGNQARFIGEEEPDPSDFSVTKSIRRKNLFTMCGPSRFLNHDCESNAQLVLSESSEQVRVVALRKICVGEEITASYDHDAFDDCGC